MSPGPAVGSTTVPASLGRLRAAVYIRVSTSDQNCELQIRDLQDYAAQREWEVVGIYEDVMSGMKSHRPALTALMSDARAKEFDCLLVWKLDRFGRSLVDCLNHIRDLEEDGVRFIAVTQGLDTDERNPVSRLLLHVLGAAAEFERSLILERTRAGRTDALPRGFRERQGRPYRAQPVGTGPAPTSPQEDLRPRRGDLLAPARSRHEPNCAAVGHRGRDSIPDPERLFQKYLRRKGRGFHG